MRPALLAVVLVGLPGWANAAAGEVSLELRVKRAAFRWEPARELHVEELSFDLRRTPAGEAGDVPAAAPTARRAAPTRTRLRVHEARLAPPGADGVAPLSLSASLGRVDGSLELEGTLGPGTPDEPLVAQPWSCVLEARQVDAEALRELLPPSWGFSAAQGRLDGRLALQGRSPDRTRGDLAVEIEEGSLHHLGIHHEAPLRFESGLAFGSGPTRLGDARLRAASTTVGRWTGTDVDASFSYEDRLLEVSESRFSMFGGELEQHGRVRFAEVPSFEIESRARDIDTGAATGNTDPEPEPVLAWQSTLRGRWTGEDDWPATLEGKARLDLEGGYLQATSLRRSLTTALLSRIPGVEKPQDADPGRTPLHHAGATFEIQDGVADSEDVRVVTRDYVLNAKARIDTSDLTLDMTGRVALTVAGVGRVLSLAGLDLQGLVSVPAVGVKATGPLRDPSFETDASGLPVAAWKLVPRTVGRARGAAEKGAGAVVDAAKKAGDLLLPSGEASEAPSEQGD